jgi:hypothetical protein
MDVKAAFVPQTMPLTNCWTSFGSTQTEYAALMAQAKADFAAEVSALRQELINAYREINTLRAYNALLQSERGPKDVLN